MIEEILNTEFRYHEHSILISEKLEKKILELKRR